MFLPPSTSWLKTRLVSRNATRLRKARAVLEPKSAQEREALRCLAVVGRSLRGAKRVDFLLSPDLRAWLSTVEEAAALKNPPAGAGRFLEMIAQCGHLADVMPTGRLDGSSRRRSRLIGKRAERAVLLRLPLLLAFMTPVRGSFGPFTLEGIEEPEEGRRTGELHFPFPLPMVLESARPVRFWLVRGGLRIRAKEPLLPRPVIPGSPIVIAHQVVLTRNGPRIAGLPQHAATKLGDALDLVRETWDEAHREVLSHTHVVIPLRERDVVSTSLPARPGVSYINLEGKSLVSLADDLLHETAHHRLHSFEEIHRLDEDDGEPRYHSPWRRSLRPLRGILHATYTFTWRAELLSRLQRSSRRLPRVWIGRELRREVGMLKHSLRDLADADGRGLLTREGSHIRKALDRRVKQIAARAARWSPCR